MNVELFDGAQDTQSALTSVDFSITEVRKPVNIFIWNISLSNIDVICGQKNKHSMNIYINKEKS